MTEYLMGIIATGAFQIGGIIVAIFAALIFILMVFAYGSLWLQARLSGAAVSFAELIGMTLRKVNARTITVSRITAAKAGIELSTAQLESHFLAGGRVPNVVRALIAATRANIELSWETATAIDLAGRDILEAVQTSVNPKVIDCPDPRKGRDTVDAVAQDGIQLKAKARVTVRANIARLIGGATEETIIARVGEGIVTTIGSAITYKSVLENPDGISKAVLAKGLDAGTAFEILSIDIADVDVGVNVGAQLQGAQAGHRRSPDAPAGELPAQERQVEPDIVGHEDVAVHQTGHILRHVGKSRRSLQVGIPDPGQASHPGGDGPVAPDEALEPLHHPAAPNDKKTDLDDLVHTDHAASCFKIDHGESGLVQFLLQKGGSQHGPAVVMGFDEPGVGRQEGPHDDLGLGHFMPPGAK